MRPLEPVSVSARATLIWPVSVCALLFALTITLYKAYIRGQNRLLDGDPDEVKQAMEVGLTQEQVDMGWRYEGF